MDTPLKMSESSRGMDKKPFVNHNQITQNVKDLLASREVENIFENSDFVYMLNQAGGDRQILAKQLGISPHQLSYVTHSGEGAAGHFPAPAVLCDPFRRGRRAAVLRFHDSAFRGPLPEKHRAVPHYDHKTTGNKGGRLIMKPETRNSEQ